jgi:hypothetical protein
MTVLATVDGDLPLQYDSIGFVWQLLNYVVRPDVWLTQITGGLIWASIVFTVLLLSVI